MALANFDADELLDVFFDGSDGQHALYRQVAPGKFDDAARQLALGKEPRIASITLFGDTDGDDDLELLLGSRTR